MQKEKKDKHFIKKPVYPGGIKAMRKLIQENLRYPEDALANKIEGTVVLKYDIDHLGAVVDAKVIAGLGHGCDEEAIRLVKMFRFNAPKNRGVKVRFHKDIHIHFRLPKKKAAPKAEATTVTYTISAPSEQKQEEKKGDTGGGYSYTITIK
jgi:TonB family protein